jgi:putative tricarboxylic transport membrane protein
MTGVYVGGECGGLITACLIGIPGTPSAIATMFDGYPMAKKASRAARVWLGVWASWRGGLLGAVFLIAATGPWPLSRWNSAPGSTSPSSCWRWHGGGADGGLAPQGLWPGPIGSGDHGASAPIPSWGAAPHPARLSPRRLPFLPFSSASSPSPDRGRRREDGAGGPAGPAPIANPTLSVSHAKVIGEICRARSSSSGPPSSGSYRRSPRNRGQRGQYHGLRPGEEVLRHPERFGTGIPRDHRSESSNNSNVAGSL